MLEALEMILAGNDVQLLCMEKVVVTLIFWLSLKQFFSS